MITSVHAAAGLAAVLFTATASASPAGAEQMLNDLKRKFPKTEFTRVQETNVPHIYEVQMGDNVAFVSEKNPRYFVLGRMFDTQTLRDVTSSPVASGERAPVRTVSIEPRMFPLADAIKTVRGAGSRALYVFSDPACPYCKKLETELGSLDDVTIYTFLLPFQGRAAPLAVWCAPDRAKAWQEAMRSGVRLQSDERATCAHPLDRNLAFADRLGVVATPTIIFADGTRIDGYVKAGEIDAQFKLAAARRPTNVTAKESQP